MKKKIIIGLIYFLIMILLTNNIYAEEITPGQEWYWMGGGIPEGDGESCYDVLKEAFNSMFKYDSKNKTWVPKNGTTQDEIKKFYEKANEFSRKYPDYRDRIFESRNEYSDDYVGMGYYVYTNYNSDGAARTPEEIEEAGRRGSTFTGTGDLITRANSFIERGSNEETIGEDDLADVAKPIAKMLFQAAIIILLIVTLVMGIKFMVANPEEQGKLKQQLVGLVISAVVIIGAYSIWEISVNLMNSVTT